MQQEQVEADCSPAGLGDQFAPDWTRQRVFVAVPTQQPDSGKEWRLCSRVVSFGQLMLALGHQYTARDIDLFWQSMIIAAEKAQVKEHRSKKRTADSQ